MSVIIEKLKNVYYNSKWFFRMEYHFNECDKISIKD